MASWIVVVLSYLIGSIPTAYLVGRLQGKDIWQLGDRNVGTANAFRQLGPAAGITALLVDLGKGALAIIMAQAANMSQFFIMLAGAAAVIGHNWPIFLNFRGGRGEATTVGILLVLLTKPMLILFIPALATLLITKNVIATSVVLFVPLPLVSWWLGYPGLLIVYAIALLCLVAITHFLRTRQLRSSDARSVH